MHILLVDDDAALRKAFRRVIERCGHEVTEAESGSEAYRNVIIFGVYDAIITDMRMRDGNGLELIELLHRQNLRIPCRLHSSDDFYMDGHRPSNLGDMVKKYPFASFALKSDIDHVERFLEEVQTKSCDD